MAASIINIEEGHPPVEGAIRKLRLELGTLRRIGINQVKVIHGYGSSGVGGAIKAATHECLRTMKNEGRIREFCPGELFGPFEPTGRAVISACSDFRKDPDWARQNDGITIVILK